MKRPCRPRSSNFTTPVTNAKSVSSLPRPTFSPAWCFVPRCRTSIVPALTSCPPKRLTPSLCPCESRPFVEEPPPFLCAMTQSLFHNNFQKTLNLDVAHLHGREILTVASLNLVLVRLLELQHGQFLGAPLLHDLPRHRGFLGLGTHKDLFVAMDRKDVTKIDLFADFALHPLDADGVAGRDAILFSPSLYHRVHHSSRCLLSA